MHGRHFDQCHVVHRVSILTTSNENIQTSDLYPPSVVAPPGKRRHVSSWLPGSSSACETWWLRQCHKLQLCLEQQPVPKILLQSSWGNQSHLWVIFEGTVKKHQGNFVKVVHLHRVGLNGSKPGRQNRKGGRVLGAQRMECFHSTAWNRHYSIGKH